MDGAYLNTTHTFLHDEQRNVKTSNRQNEPPNFSDVVQSLVSPTRSILAHFLLPWFLSYFFSLTKTSPDLFVFLYFEGPKNLGRTHFYHYNNLSIDKAYCKRTCPHFRVPRFLVKDDFPFAKVGYVIVPWWVYTY